jgi:ABC-type multidrug transport system fused ATPase/permease subunit
LNSLEKDTDAIISNINLKLKKDSDTRAQNFSKTLKSSFFTLISIMVFLCVMLTFVSKEILTSNLGNDAYDLIQKNLLKPYKQVGSLLPKEYQSYQAVIMLGLGLILLVISKLTNRKMPTLTKKQKKNLAERRDFLQNFIKNKKKKLYDEYLQQSVVDYELREH